MTPIQQKIYRFISDYLAKHHYSPTLVEIARGIGISPKSISLISRHIHALVQAKRLSFDKKGYRRIQLNQEKNLSLPILGRVAAGVPQEAIADNRRLDLTKLMQGKDYFLLEVKGDSMMEEGIFNGDLVICQQAAHAKEHDIIVALVDGEEATLKRISFKVPNRITLIPANPYFKPKAYLPHRVQVQGVYIGLLRFKDGVALIRQGDD